MKKCSTSKIEASTSIKASIRFPPKRSGSKYRESRGNRAGDGIRAAGAGSGRDRAGTFPAED